MHVLFLVKGTRGDVQPAAVLAHALQRTLAVHFVTHADHKVWPPSSLGVHKRVQEPLECRLVVQHWLEDIFSVPSPACLYLETFPAQQWNMVRPWRFRVHHLLSLNTPVSSLDSTAAIHGEAREPWHKPVAGTGISV